MTWSEFTDFNLAYLADLFERYRADPRSVEPALRELFQRSGPPPHERVEPSPPAVPPTAVDVRASVGVANLARAIRTHGFRAARLDPLGSVPPADPELSPETHGLREEDLAGLPAHLVGGPVAESTRDALAAIRALRRIYQGTSGYEFEHLTERDERLWLYEAVETERFRPPHDPIDERHLLDRLTEIGALERFLHRAFPGQIRFSLEGLGMMVPMIDEIIGAAAEANIRTVIIGMAHRGRLNVLAHVLNKPYEQIIGEFLGRYQRPTVSPSGREGEGWTGDVKYHLGARHAYRGGREVEMQVILAPNPSHLESVNPVVEGMCRATGERRDRPGAPLRDEDAALALLVHGDASFPGQGVVAETLNLSRLPGYSTGGTIHIIANNQIGFTTLPALGRSTMFASDLARGFEIPIVHVNADDPEACLAAARLAHAYRTRFRKDVLIDLVGYRRWGHNEGDEPSFTQPLMYARIREHPTIRELWAREMVSRGLVTQEQVDSMLQSAIERLHALRQRLAEQPLPPEEKPAAGLEAGAGTGELGTSGVAEELDTAVPLDRLALLNEQLVALPEGFHLHPRLVRPFQRRREAFQAPANGQERRVDWAHAETLAWATILADGTPIRLTGQDTQRGTFSQRHLVLHDVDTDALYTPLQALPSARASFEVWDSPLSEQAALAFEYGYSVAANQSLVVWEAQYGDFINAAQVTVDEFIVSGASKWGQRSGLVLLLPHGYEGQGPDHSNARLERFLQLAAEDNLRIVNCTTAAQYFHVLRRQASLLATDPRPLVIFTPKSLLRHPLAASPVDELARGRFEAVLDDEAARRQPQRVRRLILCSGKVYVDLASTGRLAGGPNAQGELAAVRVEELYPFPVQALARVVASYPSLEEVVWLQEEPRNMGAWSFVRPRLRDLLGERLPLRYVGRPRRASPAEGFYEWHAREQARLVAAAFQVGVASQE